MMIAAALALAGILPGAVVLAFDLAIAFAGALVLPFATRLRTGRLAGGFAGGGRFR
jgi:hypothetical protein